MKQIFLNYKLVTWLFYELYNFITKFSYWIRPYHRKTWNRSFEWSENKPFILYAYLKIVMSADASKFFNCNFLICINEPTKYIAIYLNYLQWQNYRIPIDLGLNSTTLTTIFRLFWLNFTKLNRVSIRFFQNHWRTKIIIQPFFSFRQSKSNNRNLIKLLY